MKKVQYDKISTYFKLNKKSFILATAFGILFDGLMPFVPILQGKLVDAYKEQKDFQYIIIFACIFFAFIAFVQLNRFLKRYYVRDFSNRMVYKMREVSFSNLLSENIEDIQSMSKGDIINRNLGDIKDSAEGVRKVLTEIYDSVILMIGYFISMMVISWKITLIVTVFFVLSILAANLIKKKIYKTTSNYKKTISKSKDLTLNYLENELYYRGYGAEKAYFDCYDKFQDEVVKSSVKSLVLKSSMEPIYQAVALIGVFFVIYLGGRNLADETWIIGTFTAYLSTFILVANKASKVGKVFNAAATLKVSWKRCAPYLKENNQEEKNIEEQEEFSLVVKDLSFGFNKDFVLNNISFEVKKGEILGICGTIHSGKSTLGAALSGIYDYGGSIKLQGIELKDCRNDVIDGFISYAPSEVEIFNDSLKYNIAFEDKDIKKELIISNLEEDVEKMTDKENTLLSHSTSNISGGQQKRLQIARAISHSPKMIILDNPFNAIDLAMSVKILDNLKKNYQDSIIIIICNQKEILERTDKIFFLKKDTKIFSNYKDLTKDDDFSLLLGGERK